MHVGVAVAVFPFVVRGAYEVARFLHGDAYSYMDGDCLLKMVNETAADHFAKHPVWPHRGYTSDCDVHEYFAIMHDNQLEFKLAVAYLALPAILGAISLALSPPRGGVRDALVYVPLSLLTWSMVHVTAHYMHDNVHLNGKPDPKPARAVDARQLPF